MRVSKWLYREWWTWPITNFLLSLAYTHCIWTDAWGWEWFVGISLYKAQHLVLINVKYCRTCSLPWCLRNACKQSPSSWSVCSLSISWTRSNNLTWKEIRLDRKKRGRSIDTVLFNSLVRQVEPTASENRWTYHANMNVCMWTHKVETQKVKHFKIK